MLTWKQKLCYKHKLKSALQNKTLIEILLHPYHCSYRYDWKIEEAAKNIMRTHTTAVSARMLYKLANQVRPSRSRV